ncbi:MAG TPA: ATP synthase F1 subunit delta [Planctomycetota bacterium]|nr:ATP synthase F1 subunit delta [Planctomycetota bacterium]
MASGSQVLARYASALHELAVKAGAADKAGADLHALGARLATEPAAQAQLASPRLPREKKRALLQTLLPAGCHDLVRRTLMLLVDKGRAGEVLGLAAAWDEVALAASGRAIATVTTAVPLDEAGRSRLVSQLARLTGKTIVLQEHVEPELLGGARILVGSRMIDGSVAARLAALRERLMAAPLPAAE